MSCAATYDVFVSYAHADAEEVGPIVDGLGAAGLRVWRDETEIADLVGITRAIADGLAHAKVLLAYYSQTYPQRRACQWELTAAFLAGLAEADPRRRVLVINPEASADHIHPVELRDQKYLVPGSGPEAIAASVKSLTDALTNALGSIQRLTAPRWLGATPFQSRTFVGRLRELWRIHSLLHGTDSVIITGDCGQDLVQIRGLGGLGKTMLADEYAQRWGAAFPGGIFWIRCHASGQADAGAARDALRNDQLRRMAEELEPNTMCAGPAQARQLLAKHIASNRCLWIVDDLPSALRRDQVEAWMPPHPNAKVVVTTRSREYRALGNTLDLDVLEPGDAYRLLTSRRGPDTFEERLAASAIVEDLGRHALALAVSAAYLEAVVGLKSYAQFRGELANPKSQALQLAAGWADMLPTGHEASIASTMLRSIDQLGGVGRDFLRIAAHLAVAPIRPALIELVLGAVAPYQPEQSADVASQALLEAARHSLAIRLEGPLRPVEVHILVSRTVRSQEQNVPRFSEIREKLVRALLIVIHHHVQDIRMHHKIGLEIDHAREVSAQPQTVEEAALLGLVGLYDQIRGNFESARVCFEMQYSRLNELVGPKDDATLIAAANLASALYKLGVLAPARDLQEQTVATLRETLGPADRDVLLAQNTLAEIYRLQGLVQQALELHRATLDAARNRFGEFDDLTLGSLNNLAGTLREAGELEQAETLGREALARLTEQLGRNHQATLNVMSSLSCTLYEMSCLDDARNLQEEALKIRVRELGAAHPETLTSVSTLASTLARLGDVDAAQRMEESALLGRLNVLGQWHPDTLRSMNNLAVLYRQRGRLDQARELHEAVHQRWSSQLGPEHPETLTSKVNLTVTRWEQGERQEAVSLVLEAIASRRQVLGAGHPDTLALISQLANWYAEMNDLAGSAQALRELWEACRKRRGPNNLETLRVAGRMGCALRDAGDLPHAREIFQDVVDSLAPMGSQAVPDLLTAMNALGAVAFELRDLSPAREMLERALAMADAEPALDGAISLALKENLANVVEAQRDFARSIQLRGQMLTASRQGLGLEHPVTSRHAWNLALSLAELGRGSESIEVAAEHLGWLLNTDPVGLTAQQRDIREQLMRATRQGAASE